MNKTLVCWNQCNEDEKISLSSFIKLFLKLELDILEFAFSQKDFDEKVQNWQNYKSIIILCELTWGENTKLTEFKGIELVQTNIRCRIGKRSAINLPVLFVSFAARETIITKDSTNEIISTYGLGHHFIQLPKADAEEIEDFKKMENLTELEMIDVLHFCSFDKMIAAIRHDIGKQDVEKIKNQILAVLKRVEDRLPLTNIKNELNLISNNDELILICDKIEKVLANYNQNKIASNEFTNSTKFYVILVEDEDSEFIEDLKTEAKEQKVEIKQFKNTKEALTEVLNDSENKYSVIITDFRIYDYPTDITKRKLLYPQGYTFINESIKLGRLYKYIAFSGLPRAFRIAAAENLHVNIESVDKPLMTNTIEGRKVFIEKIIDLAEQNQSQINAMASGDLVFCQLYNMLKSGKYKSSFAEYEKKISNESKYIIVLFIQSFSEDPNMVFFDNNTFKSKWLDFEKNKKTQAGFTTVNNQKDKYIKELTNTVKLIVKEIISINNSPDVETNFKNKVINQNVSNLLRFKETFLKNNKDLIIEICKVSINEKNRSIAEKIYEKLVESEIIVFQSLNDKTQKELKNISIDSMMNQFVDRLILRRFAIFIYYWFDLNIIQFEKTFDSIKVNYNKQENQKMALGLTRSVNNFYSNGFINTIENVIEKKHAICSTYLWISAKNDISRINAFSDIQFSHEEKIFFEKNYPELYKSWKNN
ncbi:hypothetical protein [Flavobacterium sp. UBA6031]|uniref:hypothetical protein n=1 Tax=Flavobacterium sp. UBA6031 TaxID=1946551 RepID=UPI0025BB7658|nr:hypothetical protein [Flavobacterium sp. UBA6031]